LIANSTPPSEGERAGLIKKNKNQTNGGRKRTRKKIVQLDKEESNLKLYAWIDLIHNFLVKII
jgi:hypothetical protein